MIRKYRRKGMCAPARQLLAVFASFGSAALAPAEDFLDVTALAGLDFVHYNAATEEKYMVETMGSGAVFLDYDGDGFIDIYVLNGAPLPGSAETTVPPANALYRNQGDGTFVEVAAAAGVAHTGFGMGAAAGDIDNDGDIDLYVTNLGPNVLYINNGDGTFSDRSASSGVEAGEWSTSAAFADYDGDGFLDLYVCRYVDFSLENHKFCGNLGKNLKAYCHPDVYNVTPSLLFRNNGDGTFTDVTRDAGVLVTDDGKSLGVVWGDYDNDGDQDLYVANDSMRNFLFRNEGDGRFTDVTLLAGVGYSEDGQTQAGMGTDFGDYDGDGWLDIIVTNLDFEYNALYHGGPGGVFTDRSFGSGIAEPSLNFVGFGTFFFDYDNDSRLDLFVANGHIIDNIDLFNSVSTYRERNFLFRNQGDGAFEEIGHRAGESFSRENVARGAAAADYDRDGDEDVLVTRCGDSLLLLRNEVGNRNGWLSLRLVGRRSNRDAVGARVTVHLGGRRLFKEVKAGSSYLSQGSLELTFGLGEAPAADRVEIRWPSGEIQELGRIGSGSRVTVLEEVGR
ncbi:MAG TPA: CRTAC1 family protein [Vicinamibacteria bacterium]